MDKNQVASFVDQAKFPVDNKLSRCVDGRYENLSVFPAIAKPGADAGDILVAFAALNALGKELSGEEVFQAVINVVGGQDNFRFHTDSHAEQDKKGAGMGCGHIKFAHLNPESYGLKPEQTQFLLGKLADIAQSNSSCQVVLAGDHAETAVIVVDSDHYTLKPLIRRDSGLQEAFIYQKTLHSQQLQKLAEVLSEKCGLELDKVKIAVQQACDKQLSETLKNLAEGKPVYTVKFDNQGAVVVE